jgi:hypothetical protein
MASSAERMERLKALYRRVQPTIEKLSGRCPTEAWFVDRCAEAEAWLESRKADSAEKTGSPGIAALKRRVERLERLQAERNS